jgi:hypothetical protein
MPTWRMQVHHEAAAGLRSDQPELFLTTFCPSHPYSQPHGRRDKFPHAQAPLRPQRLRRAMPCRRHPLSSPFRRWRPSTSPSSLAWARGCSEPLGTDRHNWSPGGPTFSSDTACSLSACMCTAFFVRETIWYGSPQLVATWADLLSRGDTANTRRTPPRCWARLCTAFLRRHSLYEIMVVGRKPGLRRLHPPSQSQADIRVHHAIYLMMIMAYNLICL